MKRLRPENPTLFDFVPEFSPLFPLNDTGSEHERGQNPGNRQILNLFPALPLTAAKRDGDEGRSNSTMIASEPKSTQAQTGVVSNSNSLPAHIIDVPDDGDGEGDGISLLYAKPTWRTGGTNYGNAISVEQYFEDRDLELAIMASLSSKKRVIINLEDDDEDENDVFQVLPSKTSRFPSISGIGESSQSKSEAKNSTCEICVDLKSWGDMFRIMGCDHSYCSDCMVKYVASKLQENITQIQCPVAGCRGLLEPEHCRSILPPEVFDRWGKALCEAVILATDKFYCPYRDCSALLINDDEGRSAITQSECPNCHREFCAQCKVPWHSGIECEEFQKLGKDEREREDIMLMQLAQKKKWIRCPKCRFYVEKSQGCLFMRCRCGHTFCYNCGAPLLNHYCTKCRH
ncbi:hypothetical protein NMG60_11005663 [Bertholletia excelsa]